jgi:hypothetical protein
MGLYRWLLDRWGALGLRWRLALVGSFALVLVIVSVAGYRQWHYMQHDNRFCTSCHLMRDPYERFTRSAHAQLECHSCHKARLPEQLRQLYLTVFERPTEIGTHANVPNEVCGTCHIRGDSTRWRIIASTAGHRVHLESSLPALRAVRCVDCHGVTVHEFAPVDRTCGQTGCHANNVIRLGKMGTESELHCTACHTFLAEARGLGVDSLGRPLTPRAQQCLTCHAMQVRVRDLEIGLDPHRGVCGDCHNPHTQTSAREVSCATGECHKGWQTVTFHVGVPHPERCTTCHLPHSWRIEGRQCTRCHREIEREPTTRGRAERRASDDGRADRAVLRLASAATYDAAPALQSGRPPRAAASTRFSHGDHRRESCASCHSSRVRHGELLIRSAADCQRCHHFGPGRENCTSCHRRSLAGPSNRDETRTFQLVASGRSVSRRIGFDHARHAEISCARCHSEPLSRAPATADCSSCHAAHHRPAANCVTCHADANALTTHRAADHATCSSPSCHGARASPATASREACLMCHTAQTRHMPGRLCDQCHRVVTRDPR